MSGIRLTAIAGTLFATSYFGVAWVMAGTPVPGMPLQLASLPSMVPTYSLPKQLPSAKSPPPETFAPTVTALPSQPRTLPPVSAVPVEPPRSAQPAALPRGDGDAQRDMLRLAALEASSAYVVRPCDEPAKAMMIRAVSAYAKAWADMMGCGPDGCDYKKINITAATFSTPLDIQVRDAIGAAFDKRGVAIDDFPSQLRINVAMLVRGRGAPATACPQSRAQLIR